jgi:1-acyl-sn-glycerol-3-phosphate acyltransferase
MEGPERQAGLERFREGLRRAARGPRPFHQGPFEKVLRAVIRLGCRLFAWRLEVTGIDRIPAATAERLAAPAEPASPVPPAQPSGRRPRGAGCIVVGAPHRAWVEPFLLALAWPSDAARLVWVGEGATMTASWWRRRLLPRLGLIPIGPGAGGPRAYADMAAEALSAGAAVAIAPEKGPPSAPHRTRTIAPGFAYMALRSGAPIVPVVFGGTHRLVRDVTFTVDVLEPIDPGPAVIDPFTPEHRARAGQLVEAYRAAVDAVLPERAALADARRPARERWRWLGGMFR